MRIDRSETIAGQPIKKIRDFLRRLSGLSYSVEGIEDYFSLTPDAAATLIFELCARNLLEPTEARQQEGAVYYEQGSEASRLAAANLLRPIRRARATQLLEEFLLRVGKINARDDLVYEVAEVRFFGSYLNKMQEELGDIDLAVELRPRRGQSAKEATDASLARAILWAE